MTMLNLLSTPSLLLAAIVGLTLGACDPKMIGKETQGDDVCKDGETMPAEDGCNDCTCVDGAWTCTAIACGDPPDAVCEDGAMMPSDDGCNECTCYEGEWSCTKKACEPDVCEPGETKKIDCNSCGCVDGGWVCTEIDCGAGLCGDGVVNGGETCDDGNKVDDDACANDCGVGGTDTGNTDTGNTDTGTTDTGETDTGGTDTGEEGVCGDGIVSGSETCDDGNLVDDDGCPNDCGVGGDVCGPKDPLEIGSAKVVADALEVEVTYGGGCEEHVVGLCWDGSFAESEPVQTWISLSHDAHGDLCDALITETRTIDLGGMKTAYQDGYKTQNGTIVLHLEGWPKAIDYSF